MRGEINVVSYGTDGIIIPIPYDRAKDIMVGDDLFVTQEWVESFSPQGTFPNGFANFTLKVQNRKFTHDKLTLNCTGTYTIKQR